LVAPNSADDRLHKFLLEARFHTLPRAKALINEKVKQLIDLIVRKTEFTFVCLAIP
jgi:hypothetical protein